MKKEKFNIIGLMSGSSLDGLDIAFCKFDISNFPIIDWTIIEAETHSFSQKWQNRLRNLPTQSALTFAKTHTYFGHYMGDLVNEFIANNDIEPDFISSHGHTIFHYPDVRMTSQIGDGASLATKTGLPVICDFRTHDISLEGEGTPLAPTVDRYLFPDYDFLLNLGGIANLTYQSGDKRIAFDITPCNQVLNYLANLLGHEYDESGNLARSGKDIPVLRKFLKEFPFYSKAFPKSLDNQFIVSKYIPKILNYEAEVIDKLHVCTEIFGEQIAININQLSSKSSNVLVSGGGAYNKYLLDSIKKHLDDKNKLTIPDSQIIEYKEALLMALLGLLRVQNKINCFSEITGAKLDSIGGAIYQGTKKLIL